MEERVWLRISHLRLFNWSIHNYGGNDGPHILFDLGLGDFRMSGINLKPSGDGDDAYGIVGFGNSQDRIMSTPASYKLAGVQPPELLLEDALAGAIWRHFKQPQNWRPMQRFYDGGELPYEEIIAPVSWGGRSLWVPVDYVDIFNVISTDIGLYADVRLGHHLVFSNKLIDGRYRTPLINERIPSDDFWRRAHASLVAQEQYQNALLRESFTSPRTKGLIEQALVHAQDEGLLKALHSDHSRRNPAHYIDAAPGVDTKSAPPLVILSADPPAVVAA